MKVFNVYYIKNSKKQVATCSEHSLNNIRKDIENMGGRVLSIEIREPKGIKKQEDPVKKEKSKYYVSRYNYYYKKHENKRISTDDFIKVKDKLRELKNDTKSLIEYQEKFEQFLKDNNL